MFERCTRILAQRWGLLIFGIGEAVMLTFWLAHGRLPQANRLVIVPGLSMATSRYVALPVAAPRLLDPLLATIPIALLVWAIERRDVINRRYALDPTSDFANNSALVLGTLFGTGGWVIVAGCGIQGAVVGTAITCAVILFAVLCSRDSGDGLTTLRNYFMTELVAVNVLWGLLILTHGIVAASFFALICLATALVVHFGLPLLGLGIGRYALEPFARNFLTCPVEKSTITS